MPTTAGDDLQQSGKVTKAIALADLVLEVVDPPQPLALAPKRSTRSAFAIGVRHRGRRGDPRFLLGWSRAAFRRRWTEHDYAGHRHVQSDSNLEAGGVAAFKVTANASKPGNHRLRVELHCKSPVTKLIQEEATFLTTPRPRQATPANGPQNQLKKAPVGG